MPNPGEESRIVLRALAAIENLPAAIREGLREGIRDALNDKASQVAERVRNEARSDALEKRCEALERRVGGLEGENDKLSQQSAADLREQLKKAQEAPQYWSRYVITAVVTLISGAVLLLIGYKINH